MSSPSLIPLPCFYLEALTNIVTPVAILQHIMLLSMIQCKYYHMEVSTRQKLYAECFSRNDLHIVRLTVNKWIFCLVAIDCRKTVVLFTSRAEGCYSLGCLCATSFYFIVNHCKHYHLKLFSKQKFPIKLFDKKRRKFLVSNSLPYCRAYSEQELFRLVSTVYTTTIVLCASLPSHL